MPSYGGKQYPGAPPLVRGPGGHPVRERKTIKPFPNFQFKNIFSPQYDHFSRPHSTASVRRESVAARRVFRLRSYRDGQLFRFDVPADTRMAVWKFGTNRTRAEDGGDPGQDSGRRDSVLGGGGGGGPDVGAGCRQGTVSV